jgi:hypothetical protein
MPKQTESAKGRRSRRLHTSVSFLLCLAVSFLYLPGRAQEEEEEFKGVGIHLRLYGGWAMFSGGDLKKGTAGMYDHIAADLSASGYELSEQVMKSFASGYELGGDIVYYFTPRLGAGLGGGFVRGHKSNSILFNLPGGLGDYMMTAVPELKLFSLRLGLFLSLPLNQWLTFCASAGPAWHWAEFRYTGSLTTPVLIDHIHQDAKAGHWGAQGGIGLEIRMNPRLAFILEARGRYAKISGFEGNEVFERLEGNRSVTGTEEGTLYIIDNEEYPRLDVAESIIAIVGIRPAELDFSGVSLRAGLNFKF